MREILFKNKKDKILAIQLRVYLFSSIVDVFLANKKSYPFFAREKNIKDRCKQINS